MGRGNTPRIYAYPAGIDDLAVGALAVENLLLQRGRTIPPRAIKALIILGMADFAAAFLLWPELQRGRCSAIPS